MTGPHLILLHTNAGGPVSVDSFYASMQRQLAAGNSETTIPHFQVAIDGDFAQFVPLDQAGVTCYRANSFTVGIETADHGGNVTAEPWTAAQVATLVRIVAWVASVTGIPLQRPSSWTTTGVEGHCASETLHDGRGFNYPNTSNASHKICPGVARIAQIDGIIAAAIKLNKPAIPTPPPPPPIITGDNPAMFRVFTVKDAAGLGEWLLTANGLTHTNGDVSAMLDEAKLPSINADKATMRGLFVQFGQDVPKEFA